MAPASAAPTLLAVKIISFALLSPMTLGSLCVPPAPGMMASAVSGAPNTALSPQTLTSAASAISSPPPSAAR